VSSLPVVRHHDLRIVGDPARVVAKPFLPGEQIFGGGPSRIEVVARRILAMPEHQVAETLEAVTANFALRHRNLKAVLDKSHALVAHRLDLPADLSDQRRSLIGAYFTHEYSIEAAALSNPSLVAGPDQSGLDPGETRFIMSLRAIGEGHISSIQFRSGVIGADRAISLEPPSRFAMTGNRTPRMLDRGFLAAKLDDMGALNAGARQALDRLGLEFTMADLETMISGLDYDHPDHDISIDTTRTLHWLASSNYGVSFPASTELSERVIFPAGPTESHGMEDLRLVRFVDDDGQVTYYGTYTAFDGHQILPQLLATTDFVSFEVSTLYGESAQNKGIALFPRKLDGHFVALGRNDNMNNYVMTSTDVHVWRRTNKIQEPKQPWELIQLGNCGSPLETEAGWLVITHGVGPFRRYTLGALLLDLDDPHRVIGHLSEPLLAPIMEERDGYVPNVVYSCGSMIHNGQLVLPYGFADVGTSLATVDLDALVNRLLDP
jgi:predicted GH43/DUF377 family glycosyl hydrolase